MAVAFPPALRASAKIILDFALPPRCPGCGIVIEEAGLFCDSCWGSMEWLGDGGCEQCGLPLAGTEAGHCARCLAVPPRLDRMRAAVAYDDLPRSLALRLKYGRKVGMARTMARYMAPLGTNWDAGAILVPVPLHRWRLWNRGFNQSVLLAAELGRAWALPVERELLHRPRATRPLKGMSASQRREAVRGAFAVSDRTRLAGRTVILIDDVLTSGSTAEACATALRRAGASRVEVICWARVVRPSQLMR